MASTFPQVHDPMTTLRMHATVALSLVPVAVTASLRGGWYTAFVVVSTPLAFWLFDRLLDTVQKKVRVEDGSALLWGLLFSFCLPPNVPFFVPWVAAGFAIFVVKGALGGVGAPWINPLMASWVVCQTAWPWAFARPLDATTGSTVLTLSKHASVSGDSVPSAFLTYAATHGIERSAFDVSGTEWLNNHVFSWMNVNLPGGYLDLIVGNSFGSIGEGSTLLLLLATVFLVVRGFVPWTIPAFYFLGFSVSAWAFGALAYGGGWGSGDVLFHIFSGSFLIGLFFFATESSSRPLNPSAKVVFASFVGIAALVLRLWGPWAEGTAYAILLGNLLVPWLEKKVRVKKKQVAS